MIDQNDRRVFSSFWRLWKRLFNELVTAKGGALVCPDANDISFEETPSGFCAMPKYPICLFSVPHKGNSGKTLANKMVIFIDGTFEFQKNTEQPSVTVLISAQSNVAFFKSSSANNDLKLELIDAYHFDHFTDDPKESAPHPIFPARR